MTISRWAFTGATVAFTAWTAFSFLCHWCAKQYFSTTEVSTRSTSSELGLALLLTISQSSLCLFIFRINVKSQSEDADNTSSNKALALAFLTHFAATFSTNCGLALMNASSVLTMKLMEPIMSAFIIWCVTGKRASITTWFSLVLVVTGTVGFIGGPSKGENVGYGVALAVISNILYGLRNVILKHFLPNREVEFRNRENGALQLLTGVGYYLFITHWGALASLQLVPLDYVILSAIFHVGYSYVSTFVVLEYLSVVSHAVANIMKRILVVLAMMFVGQREQNIFKFLWLGLCCLGLGLYTRHKMMTASDKAQKEASSDDKKDLESKQLKVVQSLTSVLLIALVVTCVGLSTSQQKALSESQYIGRDLPIHRGVRALQAAIEEPAAVDQPQSTNSNPLFEKYISDSQQRHLEVFQDILKNKSSVILLNVLPHEHGKDEAIVTVGLLRILDQFPVKVVQYCYEGTDGKCQGDGTGYPQDDVIIFVQVFPSSSKAGNQETAIAGTFSHFPKSDVTFLLSEDRWTDDDIVKTFEQIQSKSDGGTVRVLFNSPYMSQVVGDKFPSLRSSLIPHLGLSIGTQEKFSQPQYDVVWTEPADSSPQTCQKLRDGLLCDNRGIDETWKIPKGQDILDNSYTRLYLSYLYFVRGRVAVVNSLHGHVLCSLLSVPHVMSNVNTHVTNYTNQWLTGSHSIDQVVLTNDKDKTVELVEQFLDDDEQIVPLWPVAAIIKTYWK